MSTVDHAHLDAFVAACRAAGIARLALCWRQEWGPQQLASSERPGDYDQREELRILGYAGGTLHVCQPQGIARDELAAELEAQGFAVELRARNLSLWE